MAVGHVLGGLEEGEFIVAGLAVVGAELGAVAALVAHLVDVDDLAAAVGGEDGHVGPVGAGVHAVLADGGALEAALPLASGAAGHSQDALPGHHVGSGGIGLGGNLIGVGMAQNLRGEGGGIGDALHHRGGAAHGVTGGVNAFHVGAEAGAALAVQRNAVGGHEGVVHLLAYGGDHQVAGDGEGFAGAHGAAAAVGVGLAQAHLFARQQAVRLGHGGRQLGKSHTVGHGQGQLMLVGGHILPGAAVDDGDVLRAAALGKAGGVHGGIAGADDGHVAADADEAGLDALHPLDGACHVAGDVQLAGLPGTGGKEDVGVALGLQLRHGGGRGTALHLHAPLLHHGDVLLDGLVGDAEGGNHVAGHAAQAVLTLEDGDGHALTGQEGGGGDTGGAAADDGGLFARRLFGGADVRQHGLVAVLGGHQLGVPDMDGRLVEVAGALVLAAVGTDGAGDEGQGVLLHDEAQGGAVEAAAHQLQILGDVLLNGAAAAAGSAEAVHPGHLLLALAGGQGLDGLDVVVIRVAGGGQGADGLGVGVVEGPVRQGLHLLHHLQQAVVAAGL